MTKPSMLLALTLSLFAAGCATRAAEPELAGPAAGSAFATELEELHERSVKSSAPEAQWRAIESLRAIPDEAVVAVASKPLLRACRMGRGQDVASVLSEYLTKVGRAGVAARSVERLVLRCGIMDWTPREERVGFVGTSPDHYAVVSEARVVARLTRTANLPFDAVAAEPSALDEAELASTDAP
jgi:hypothetical protein